MSLILKSVWGVFLLLTSFQWVFASFDGACFTQRATLISSGSNESFRAQVADRSDLFFVSGSGHIIGSLLANNAKRERIPYILSSPSWLRISASDARAVSDGDPKTIFRLPIEARSTRQTLLIDFKTLISAGQIVADLDIVPDRDFIIEISSNGELYVPVDRSGLTSFDIRYIRLSLPRLELQTRATEIADIRFEKPQISEFIFMAHSWALYAYQGFSCTDTVFAQYALQRESANLAIRVDPRQAEKISIASFENNPLYRYDTDSDSILDSEDNCPAVSNTDQQDRNKDGVGDVCSDDDSDTIFGQKDNCPLVKNADQRDVDANGVGDACQFDADLDGKFDGEDTCPQTANPKQEDADEDGVGDVCDNCSLANKDQSDLNKNGKWDVCDDAEQALKNKDTDRDVIIDSGDNCVSALNKDQKDTDKDGVGDVCDNCVSIQNPDQKDSNANKKGDVCEDIDLDTIVGWRDNCPTVANPDQRDADNNSVGDVCEDTDSDGIFDSVDNAPATPNSDQSDIDNDGVGDVADESDGRFLEQNKTLFIALATLIAAILIGWIFALMRKLQGASTSGEK